jgi:hypothetical protein
MGLDIRTPIGIMFALLGLLLAGYGLLGDKSIYARSLGWNVNLLWGLVLLVFGGIMWYLGSREPGGTATKPIGEEPTTPPRGH